MKKFKFRLERVLDFRERVKDEKKRELGRRLAIKAQIEEQIADLEKQALAGLIEEGGTYSGSELADLARYKQRLNEETVKALDRLESAVKDVEIARQAYIEASKDTQALEKLKEKKKTDHQEDVLKTEAEFLDEMTTQRIARRERI